MKFSTKTHIMCYKLSTSGGHASQHMCYLPFGEQLVTESSISFENRYTFSGKERDTETGYSYSTSLRSVSSLRLGKVQTHLPLHSLAASVGARYYNSDLSIWLSVDPMADKYPGLSPYTYCANNPVKLVDPNGMDIWHPDGQGNLIADKGDNAWTLASTLNISSQKAINLLADQGYNTNERGVLNLTVGDKLDVSSSILGAVGLSTKNCNSSFRFTNSKGNLNFKLYKNGWKGNQWVKPTSISRIGKVLGKFGNTFGYFNALYSVSQLSPNNSVLDNVGHTLDAGMSIVGTTGVYGFAASMYYSTILKNAPAIINSVRKESVIRAEMIQNGYPALRIGIK